MNEIYEKMAHAKNEHNAKLLLATSSYVDYGAWKLMEDNMDIWDYRTILEYYDKYFFDPDTWWEEFQYFIDRKKVAQLVSKQQKEQEEIDIRRNKESSLIQRQSNALRAEVNFEILRGVRKKEATKYWIYPNYVFSDAVLLEMVKRRPQTRLEFLRIPWIGEEKYRKHCNGFAEAIRSFKD